MASEDKDSVEAQPQPFNANSLEPAKKRQRPATPSDRTPNRARSRSPHGDERRRPDSSYRRRLSPEPQPEPFDAHKLQPARKRLRSISPARSAPRRPIPRSPRPTDPEPLDDPEEENRPRKKRPAGRSRITDAEKEAIRQRQLEREKAFKEAEEAQTNPSGSNGNLETVRQHYNAVPERNREWRKTDSRIKGLRSFNNWVKSALIQKFSPDEDFTPGISERGGPVYGGPPPNEKGLLVLDLGCGKGGDLQKWQQAPQRVDLYVGLDPADVSIGQARDRYREMVNRGRGGGRGRGGRGGYNRPPPRVFHSEFFVQDCFAESIQNVPIVREVGFDTSGGPSRFGGGRFDVVSMMFCMHYAFESEEKARMMLQNVSGALKKGGRLIGTIPNSDVLSENVVKFNERMAANKQPVLAEPSKDTEAPANPENGEKKDVKTEDKPTATEDEPEEGEAPETAEWGNSIYRVRFPDETPKDGIFRPPFGWKYNYFLDEAVGEIPEYVVPWEAFRAIAEDYNLEMQYHKPFLEVWKAEKDDDVLGPLSERMGVRGRGRGELLPNEEELEAASFYTAFCFYKV
jgi:mRNA (guanine-N7-)-methyltransferase